MGEEENVGVITSQNLLLYTNNFALVLTCSTSLQPHVPATQWFVALALVLAPAAVCSQHAPALTAMQPAQQIC